MLCPQIGVKFFKGMVIFPGLCLPWGRCLASGCLYLNVRLKCGLRFHGLRLWIMYGTGL